MSLSQGIIKNITTNTNMIKILLAIFLLGFTSCAYYEPGAANNSVNTYVQPTYAGYGYGGYGGGYGYGGYYPYGGGYYPYGYGGWGGGCYRY